MKQKCGSLAPSEVEILVGWGSANKIVMKSGNTVAINANVLLLKTIINFYLLIELKAKIDRKCFLFINYLYPSKIDTHKNSSF
jgi:hypothetical protein